MTEHKAIYTNQKYLPDYEGNPLIEALPPVLEDSSEVIDMLSYSDEYRDEERQYPARYRMHYVFRLFRYFQPLEQHLDIEERFSHCIRQGYLHRSPLTPDYAMALADGHKAIKSGEYTLPVAYNPTGSGFTIIGLSGIGKTSAVTRVLSLYPQVVVHSHYRNTPLVLKQIVWLKLECPHDGLVKGLCMEFFSAFDRAAETNYFEMYAKRSTTIDLMMQRMEQIARLHCVGVIVIDEIQHLCLAKSGGSEKMLNFLVNLVNKVGIPIVLIGTPPAKDVLEKKFRQARRSSGHQGDLLWDKMDNDTSWDIFASSMWKYQWTRQVVPLSGEFKDALYFESQGITDIAVKLYAMAQIRAIGLQTDTLAPGDFGIVASEKLGLVKSALDALRSGDKKRIDAIGDIALIGIEDYYAAYLAMLPQATEDIPEKRNNILLSEQAALMLSELGVDPTTAKKLVGKVMAAHMELRKVGDIARIACQLYESPVTQDKIAEEEDGDLRNANGYADVKSTGAVKNAEW